jgi:putative phosphotransacetylase
MVVKEAVVGVSARHAHLSQEDVEKLFGEGHQIEPLRELSFKGVYAAKETVTVKTEKGTLENIRVLGPVRKQTQIELARTDCFKLGIKPPVRESGHLAGSTPVTLIGPKGTLELPEGAIIAARHIHIGTDTIEEWGKKSGDTVKVRVGGERGIVFENVVLRAGGKGMHTELHLDTDEANAAMLNTGDIIEVILED